MNQLSRRERERQIREAEIISAAEKLFCQKGFHDASMDEIARLAQFAKGTVYQYFTNKEDLYFDFAAKSRFSAFRRLFHAISRFSNCMNCSFISTYICCNFAKSGLRKSIST